MKKDIVLLDKEKSIYQITTTDERWYTRETVDPVTKLPVIQFVPSVTWICGYVPKGIEFYKWLANKGWDEAEAIKADAADKGSKIHQACETLLLGEAVGMQAEFSTGDDEKKQELSPDEYTGVVSFTEWFNTVKPEIIMNERYVVSTMYGYAGTVDFICRINGQVYIIDFKTSQYIWPSMEAQLSAYKQAVIEMVKSGELVGLTVEEAESARLAVLQLGYKRNKKAYKFNDIEDKFQRVFLPAREFWLNATEGQKPKQYELPVQVKLNFEKPEEPQAQPVKAKKKYERDNNKTEKASE